ncbi:solute carrier family 15 member 4 [Exaiptasia diaphana]|uniref:Uncharacterized protein n=1 Tax=Exaiptasia diaphana TaxID=2652724 RepID=A0A913YCA4_EXADI|nr:solute carrier family 15 member 4 [Exaiptasia diaphana]
MPLIVNGEGSLAASYRDRDLVHQFYEQPQEPTETTPLSPHKSDAFKLHRRIKMRRFCIACLVLAELCERFAFYCIIINLALFMDNFGWSMFASACGVLVYSCIAWFMCALGGLVADSRFGRYSTIVAGYFVYFIGAIALVAISVWMDNRKQQTEPDENLPILPWLAVVLLSIGIGEGAVKANLSTFSAEQLRGEPPNGSGKSLFNCFYWVANALSLCCLAGVGFIQQTRLEWSSGFTLGFAIPVGSLTCSAAAFLASSRYFVVKGPHGTGLRNFWLIVKQAWNKRHDKVEIREMAVGAQRHPNTRMNWLHKATVQFGGTFLNSEVHEARALGKSVLFCSALIPYWIIYSQLYSTYLLQGLHLMSTINQFVIPAAWMSLIEIAVVLLLVPLMERIVYPMLTQSNIYVPRLWRVAFGMLLIAGSSGMAGYVEISKAEYFLKNGYINQTTSCRVYKVVDGFSIFNQLPQYVLLGISEVFTSMSGLELVYAACPTTPQSVTAGLYNLMISIGGVFSVIILGITSYYDWYSLHIGDDTEYLQNNKTAYYYWLLSGIVLLGVFILVAIGYCHDIGLRQPHHHHHRQSSYTMETDRDSIADRRNLSSAEKRIYPEIS